jgi:hypothetical protein
MLELHLNLQHYTNCRKKGSIYIRNVHNSFYPPEVSVFTNKSYVASKPTPATPAEGVIGSVPSPPVVAKPKHHYFQSIGKECWL